jgi:hypothetical protein
VAKEGATLESHCWLYVFRNPGVKLSVRFDNPPSLFLRWPAARRVALTLHGVLHIEKATREVIVCDIERTRFPGAQAEPQRKEDSAALCGDGRQDSVLHFQRDYAGMVTKPVAAREIGNDKT